MSHAIKMQFAKKSNMVYYNHMYSAYIYKCLSCNELATITQLLDFFDVAFFY
jgi:hypothetical protein